MESDPLQRARAELDLMKAGELKELCKEVGIKRSGKKDELKDRLLEYFEKQRVEGSDEYKEFEEMSIEDLRDALRGRSLHEGAKDATKEDLLAMLRNDIEKVNALRHVSDDSPDAYNAISKALETALLSDPDGPLGKYVQSKKTKDPPKKLELVSTSFVVVMHQRIAQGRRPLTRTCFDHFRKSSASVWNQSHTLMVEHQALLPQFSANSLVTHLRILPSMER